MNRNLIEPCFKTSGERLFPNKSISFAQHLARYEFSSQFVKNKVVLDIACGSGYGTSLLAKSAKKVYGIDISKETISYAQKKYDEQNASFLQGDARQIPLKSNSIDVVISFETLEHISEQDIFLSEIRRVLKKKGVLIISTPDKQKYCGVENPFHVNELNKKEFYNLLKRYFKEIVVFYQNTRAIIEFKVQYTKIPQPKDCSPYLIGICSDKKTFFLPYSKIFNEIDDEIINLHKLFKEFTMINNSKSWRIARKIHNLCKYLPKSVYTLLDKSINIIFFIYWKLKQNV